MFVVLSLVSHSNFSTHIYYRLPDRDMFMRFCSGGVGQFGSTLDAACVFERLNDVLESSRESSKQEGRYEEDSEDGEEEQDLVLYPYFRARLGATYFPIPLSYSERIGFRYLYLLFLTSQ